jgi:hypothetical protein
VCITTSATAGEAMIPSGERMEKQTSWCRRTSHMQLGHVSSLAAAGAHHIMRVKHTAYARKQLMTVHDNKKSTQSRLRHVTVGSKTIDA